MSEKQERPRTGGKAGDRRGGDNKRDNNKGGKSDKFGNKQKGSQPKYDDTQEAKKQKEKIDRIDDDITKIQSEIERIGKVRVIVRKPRQRLTNKDQILKEIESTKSRLQKAEEEVKTLQPENKRLLDVVNEKRQAVNRLKPGVFFFNPTEDFMKVNENKLREEVKRLEERLETETLSITEEKNVMRQIKTTKAMKQNFEPYLRRAKELRDAENQYGRNEKDFKRKTELLDSYKKSIIELQSDLNNIEEREKEAENLKKEEEKKIKESQEKEKDEKTKLEERLTELVKQYHHEKDVLVQMRDKWYEAKRQDRNKKLEEVNQDRAKKRKEIEKEERDKILSERRERRNAVPFNTEITVCQNLIVYLNELLQSTKVNDPKEQPKTETKDAPKKDEKEQGYIKGRIEHEDLLFPESSGAKKKKKVVKKKKVAAKITHNWDTFTRFEEIGLGEPPIVATKIPEAIEAVKQKLVEFQKKSTEAKVGILKKLEEEEQEERKQEEERKKREKEEKEKEKEAPKETPKEEGNTKNEIQENK